MQAEPINGIALMCWHKQDSDCFVDPDTDICIGCRVAHLAPCPDCGQRAFHKPECSINRPKEEPQGGLVEIFTVLFCLAICALALHFWGPQ